MLGLPSKNQAKIDAEDIQRLILKTRFVDETKFAEMVGRIHGSASAQQISSLFQILCESKVFGGERVVIVDLWLFLSLLRTASEESRRSYDCKTTKLATDVEFWEKANNTEQVPDIVKYSEGQRKTSKNKLYHEKHRYTKGSDSCEIIKTKADGATSDSATNNDSKSVVATLLGAKDWGKPKPIVVGKFFEEGINESDVAMAMKPDEPETIFKFKSTYKNKTNHPRASSRGSPDASPKRHNRYDRNHNNSHCWSSVFGQPEKLYVMDGVSVSALFSQPTADSTPVNATSENSNAGGADKLQPKKQPSHFTRLVDFVDKSKAANLNFKMSSHILERELVNKTSVANALGYDAAKALAGCPIERVNPQLLSFNTQLPQSSKAIKVQTSAPETTGGAAQKSPRSSSVNRYANRPQDSMGAVINGAWMKDAL
jgi:hypothetical protein